MTLQERITAYLTGGGLFNPELANHDAVRDLLIDCRDALDAQEARIKELEGALREGVELINGDLVGAEWKKSCHEFVHRAREALK